MSSDIFKPKNLHSILWYGVGGLLLVALGTRTEWEQLMTLSVVMMTLLLGIATEVDRAYLRWRGEVGESYPLSSDGIDALRAKLRPEVILCHEDGFKAELVEYDELQNGGRSPLGEERVNEALEALSDRAKGGEVALQPSLKLSAYLEAKTLPNLPPLEGRAQLGLFTTRVTPSDRIFLWESDLGVARSDARDALPPSVRMNRRTLCQSGGLDIFQGGGVDQRSNSAILANFYWCHSESTSGRIGRYLMYPPHYFGVANCEYVTTLNADGAPCSGLKTLREIEAGEQLLMYTGSPRSTLTIQVRLIMIWLTRILAPACSLLPWLWIWHEIQR